MIRVINVVVLTILLALANVSPAGSLFAQTSAEPQTEQNKKSNQKDADQIDEIRILCYNIHAGKGLDGKIDLSRIAGVIKSTNPHLVALQEVDVKTRRSGKVDQAKKLAQLCNMNSYFGKAIDYQGGAYGNAILASEKIMASNSIEVSNAGAERRVAVGVAIKVGDELVTLVSTHFDHKSQQARAQAAKTVADIVRQSKGIVLVAGDFNCPLGSQELAPLERVAASPSPQPVFTFPAANPTKQIDFIMLDRRSKWKLKTLEAIDDKGASDHRPLLAVFEIE